MTYESKDAFKAARDDTVKAVMLAGADPHFSAGDDSWGQFRAPGHEGFRGREMEIYLEVTEYRNLPKPTIAQVQGKRMAGGNMLARACDRIVARDAAQFIDHTVEMGFCGGEFFARPHELGIRKAQEWLFTADWLSGFATLCVRARAERDCR